MNKKISGTEVSKVLYEELREYLKGKDKDLINLHPIDRDECLSVFEEYHEQNKTIY